MERGLKQNAGEEKKERGKNNRTLLILEPGKSQREGEVKKKGSEIKTIRRKKNKGIHA